MVTVRRIAATLLAIGSVAGASAARAQRGEDTLPHTYILPGLGIHAGTPQKASFAVGVVLGEDWQRGGRDHSRNVALFAEPGVAAGRASLAYVGRAYGSFGSGYGIATTVLRTWKQPWTVGPNESYVGGEVFVWPVIFVGPRVGLFHNVGGPPGGKRWLVTADLGFGL